MPHPDLPDLGESSFMKACNIYVQFQHIPSGETVKFYAILNNFQDSYTPKWSEVSAYGRMDPISTFQNTTRQISIGFNIISEENKIGHYNLRDISKLINFLYPSYDNHKASTVGSLTTAPLLRMKFINLATDASQSTLGATAADGLVGYITGQVSVSPDIDEGFLTPEVGVLIPRVINLSLNYRVLHTHNLGWSGSRSRTNGKFPYKSLEFTKEITFTGNYGLLDPDAPEDEGVYYSAGGVPGPDPYVEEPPAACGQAFQNDEGGVSYGECGDDTPSHDAAKKGRAEARDPNRLAGQRRYENDSNNSDIREFYGNEIT